MQFHVFKPPSEASMQGFRRADQLTRSTAAAIVGPFLSLLPTRRVAPLLRLSRLSGNRDFDAAWNARVDAKFGDVDAHYLSLGDLIEEKESAGRDQDWADLRSLRKANRPRA